MSRTPTTRRSVPGLQRISDAVHEHGARIVMQLGHGGRQGSSTFTEQALWGPSNVPCPFNLEMPKAMESEDIEEIVEAHALGARHAKAGGMDGVEIHSGYGGYLLASFLSDFSNFRTDEYGGSLEDRMRIVLRVIAAIREEVGPDYLVGINLQGHDYSPGGLEVPDAQAIARAIDATGAVDYICVKAATYFEANQNVPRHAARQAAVDVAGRRRARGRLDPGDRRRAHQRAGRRPSRCSTTARPTWSP